MHIFNMSAINELVARSNNLPAAVNEIDICG